MKKINYTIKDIFDVSMNLLKENRIFCFFGPMGIGKTTLIKAMLQHLGAVDVGSSPTFGLVNEYYSAEDELVAYHFDFYRINSLEEALDIGLEEYFASDVPIFIEWPEKIEGLLPEEYHTVSLYFVDETTRRIEY